MHDFGLLIDNKEKVKEKLTYPYKLTILCALAV